MYWAFLIAQAAALLAAFALYRRVRRDDPIGELRLLPHVTRTPTLHALVGRDPDGRTGVIGLHVSNGAVEGVFPVASPIPPPDGLGREIAGSVARKMPEGYELIGWREYCVVEHQGL